MTTKQDKDPNFLTPSDILAAARKFVLEECSDEWPDDEWFELGNWDINVWTDDQTGEAFATAYPITPRGSTQTNQGITIPVQCAPALILAELRELGRAGKLNDMNRILFGEIVSEIVDSGADAGGYLDTLRELSDQFSRALDGIERDLGNLQGKSLLANDYGTYTLPAETNEVRIRAGEYNGKPVDVTVERRIDGGIEAGIDYNGDAYDRIWVGEE